MKKRNVTHKSKDYIRSTITNVTRTLDGSRFAVGLTTSTFYGTRVEDDEISLEYPDVANVRAIYESTDSNAPVLDRITLTTGLALDQTAIVGEKIVGEDSRAVGQVVSLGANTVDYVPLNTDEFQLVKSSSLKNLQYLQLFKKPEQEVMLIELLIIVSILVIATSSVIILEL